MEKGPLDSFVDGRHESIPTTRNRALQSGKDILSGPGAGLEFPNGLPPAPSKSEQLSYVRSFYNLRIPIMQLTIFQNVFM